MEKKRNDIREPFEPKDTPKPPQIIEPNSGRQKENPVQDERRDKKETTKPVETQETKPHLLGEDADINDETTI